MQADKRLEKMCLPSQDEKLSTYLGDAQEPQTCMAAFPAWQISLQLKGNGINYRTSLCNFH